MKSISKKLVGMSLIVVAAIMSSSCISAKKSKNPIVGIWNLELDNGDLPKVEWVVKFESDGTMLAQASEGLLQRFFSLPDPVLATVLLGTWKEVGKGEYLFQTSTVVLARVPDGEVIEFTPIFRGRGLFSLKLKKDCCKADVTLLKTDAFPPNDICFKGTPIAMSDAEISGRACKVPPIKIDCL